MNLLKTFLLTLLLLPVASWAMESDVKPTQLKRTFEELKKRGLKDGPEVEVFERELKELHKRDQNKTKAAVQKLRERETREASSATEEASTNVNAPQIYQVLMHVAAKELGVPAGRFVPMVFFDHHLDHHYWSFTPEIGAFTDFHRDPPAISFNAKSHFFMMPFSIKKALMFHEMAHVLDAANSEKDVFSEHSTEDGTACSKEREHFADTQAVIHLKCFDCAIDFACYHFDFNGSLKKKGYLDYQEIIELAKKTYGTEAQCAYHRKLEKRHSGWRDTAFWPSMGVSLYTALNPTTSLPFTIGAGLLGWLFVHLGTQWRTAQKVEQEIANTSMKFNTLKFKNPIYMPSSFFCATNALDTQARPACFSCLPKKLAKLAPEKRAKLLTEFIETKREEYRQKLEREIVDGKLEVA